MKTFLVFAGILIIFAVIFILKNPAIKPMNTPEQNASIPETTILSQVPQMEYTGNGKG